MFTQYLTDEQLNKLDPEAVCLVLFETDTNGLETRTVADLLELLGGGINRQVIDACLDHTPHDGFEILMVNSAGQIVKLEIIN